MVCPSPMVSTLSGGAKGSSSRKRHTPLKASGSFRCDHFASNSLSERGGGSRSRSYTTSMSPPQRGQLKLVSSTETVAAQAGSIQRWKTRSLIQGRITEEDKETRRQPDKETGSQREAGDCLACRFAVEEHLAARNDKQAGGV